jgi:potassium channel subfamily K
VVVDAFSNKYKSVFSLHSFDNAVRQYRRRKVTQLTITPSIAPSNQALSGIGLYVTSSPQGSSAALPEPEDPETASQRSRLAREHLENLPSEILEQARELEERVQYFASLSQGNERAPEDDGMPIPPSLQKLMKDISIIQGVSERVRAEVFGDEEARQTLFMLSVEGSYPCPKFPSVPYAFDRGIA